MKAAGRALVALWGPLSDPQVPTRYMMKEGYRFGQEWKDGWSGAFRAACTTGGCYRTSPLRPCPHTACAPAIEI
jgi:hypothetical protein